MSATDSLERYLQPAGAEFSFSTVSPDATGGLEKKEAKQRAKKDIHRMDELCYLMYAENKHALLIILQGIDASGKNSTTRHIAKGVNPDALRVHSFKRPSELELEHEFLWRVHRATPARGNVAVFNRSHYEEVIVPRVMPEILERQNLPESIASDNDIFDKRYCQINDFERMLSENGISVVKFLLHVSKDEQLKRFYERVEDPQKNWKYSKDDLVVREKWDDYHRAFEKMVRHTSTAWAPWYVIPADHKWFRNLAIGQILVDTLGRLDMQFPRLKYPKLRLEELEGA